MQNSNIRRKPRQNGRKSFVRRTRQRASTVNIPRNNVAYILPPDQQRVALKWSGTYSEVVGGFQSYEYGVIDPGTRRPKYWVEYFGIYKYAYIEKVVFRFQMTHTEDNKPARVVLAESNSQDVSPTTFLELAETPRSKQRLMVTGGNHSVVEITHATRGESIMGHRLEDDEAYWNTFTSGPAAPIKPLVILGVEPVLLGAAASINYMVTIEYHIKFFTLNHL